MPENSSLAQRLEPNRWSDLTKMSTRFSRSEGVLTGSARGQTRTPSRMFFSRMLRSRTSLSEGIDSMAPRVFNFAASPQSSWSVNFAMRASEGTSASSSAITRILHEMLKHSRAQQRRALLTHLGIQIKVFSVIEHQFDGSIKPLIRIRLHQLLDTEFLLNRHYFPLDLP